MNEFYKKDIISIKEFNKAQLEQIFTSTDKIMKLNPVERREICKGNTLGYLFYEPSTRTRLSFDAAMALIKANSMADLDKTAAIGYCFGGSMVLNMARMGGDLKGVVSFHGNLIGVAADKSLLKAKILVCHGADDQFVKPEEVEQFKKQMDSIGADYKFISYPGSTHAFSNPNASKMGEQFKIPIAYNAAADSASWKDMQDFFGRIFK